MGYFQKYETEETIKAAFSKASPAEKSQITAFTVANTEPPPAGRVSRPFGYWFLSRLTNLDTGRLFLSVGFSLTPPGVPPNVLRSAIGLPKLGGKAIAPKSPAKPLAKAPAAKTAPKKIPVAPPKKTAARPILGGGKYKPKGAGP